MDNNLNNNQLNSDSNNSNQTFNNIPNQNQVTNGTNNMANQGNMTNNLNNFDSQGMMNNNLNNMNSQSEINNNTNNINNQPLNSNMNSNNQNNNSKKNTKLYIIIGIIILLIVVGVFAFLGKKGGSNTGSTANIGESLHIVQKNDGWDFNIKVLKFEKDHSAEVLLEKKQLPAVKIEITNNSDTELLVDAISFRLLDSSNNLLANTDLWAEASNEEVIKKEIKKGDTASGYKIFSDSSYTKDGELKEYDYNDISKLEILVPINMRKEGTKVKYSYVEYYINLK
ncbi:MAG: hypothetical protein UCL21_03295 [Bacilli bacterium]|nr:hypothetical protein [Bacilli bacterium]